MNTGKQQKPVLTGQRFKTRKRDEKEKFEPTVFRDTIVQGLNEAGGDLDAVAKFLDVTGSRLDYRRYADTLFDVLMAGSMLAPGGTRIDDGDKTKVTEHCMFRTEENHTAVRSYAQVNSPLQPIVVYVKEEMKKNDLQEQAVIGLLWTCLMNAVEWNKKEELVTEQALKHLKHYAPLLAVFSTQGQSELVLLLKIQEYCYDNIHFMKSFSKIVVLFYKADVLSEEAILKWYKDAHAAKGKSVFLEQMKKFVEWLQNAEEESESEGEDN
ncbi:basic leucine zipper and W2 domain-containing protein 2 [Sinocyclocheilus grahami]|uniref:basic leucine zipper and W2 domain-containing protein 2 n=1 Tax=Sinocyclocheilus grahami TaxID=75366 RepID=UPI0007AC8C29|nr:PREDICTED: basic leucine zipper and W2 domain-containing protein 2 [Sinocyclocheilus grahami]